MRDLYTCGCVRYCTGRVGGGWIAVRNHVGVLEVDRSRRKACKVSIVELGCFLRLCVDVESFE